MQVINSNFVYNCTYDFKENPLRQSLIRKKHAKEIFDDEIMNDLQKHVVVYESKMLNKCFIQVFEENK